MAASFSLAVFTLILTLTGVSCYCTSSGLSFDCESEVFGQSASFKVNIKSCQNPVKVEVKLTVDALYINFDQTFDASQDIPVSGFSAGALGGVYLNIKMTTLSNGNLDLKLKMYAKVIFKVTSVTILDQEIPSDDCNSLEIWWSSQSDGVKGGIGVAGLVLLILLCVCCCKCCRRSSPPQSTIIMPQAAPAGNTMIVNSSNSVQMAAPPCYSNVPYARQFNHPV